MNMNNDIPKIDIPENWIIGTDISKDILNLYTNFPCRLKALIFVLCMEGDIEASIDLAHYHVKPSDFVTILPGSILQIHEVKGDLRIYFMGFSSRFIEHVNMFASTKDILYTIKQNPVISLPDTPIGLLEDYLNLLTKTYSLYGNQINIKIINHIFSGIMLAITTLYKDKDNIETNLTKAQKINKEFAQLVMLNYTKERGVAFYAKKIGITSAHLCTTVKQVTDKTCLEIISSMVIMDAKAQLKSTNTSIQDIAYSLNFTNMSFFGKYFKRYVGVGPLEYRNR